MSKQTKVMDFIPESPKDVLLMEIVKLLYSEEQIEEFGLPELMKFEDGMLP